MDYNISKIKLNNFEEFEQLAKKEICENKFHQLTKKIFKPTDTDILFRGQADASWKLESTLARDTGIKKYPEEKYHIEMASLVNTIYEHTGKQWCVSQYLHKPYIEKGHRKIFDHPLGYDFMVYLRHFGFPSPLLDWTENPYIAAYFAYSDTKSDNVAIYIYQQSNDSSMISENNSTVIHLGKYIDTHQRHTFQQAQYTVCKSAQTDENCSGFKQNFFYDSYEEYHWNNDIGDGKIQNRCTQYILPSKEKEEVLKYLNNKFITANLLFDDDNPKVTDEVDFIAKLKEEFLEKVQNDC